MHISRLHKRRVRRDAAWFLSPQGEGWGPTHQQEQLWPHVGLSETLGEACDPAL